MTLFEVMILTIIQGITESIPVSSSAHLMLAAKLIDIKNHSLAFDAALHLGSLIAVFYIFPP